MIRCYDIGDMGHTTAFDDRPLRDLTVSQVLRNRAAALGEETALTYGPTDRTVSYATLDDTANAVANALRDRGVARGDNVSVMMADPLETLLAMFGINRAGAVYAPINFEYEGAALSYQLNDTDPGVLVVEDRYVERLNAVREDLDSHPLLVVAETDEGGAAPDDAFDSVPFAAAKAESTADPGVETDWDDTASIVYTSGTTGMPKGVVIPNRWILANYVTPKMALLGPDDVVHTSLPLYHIGGVYADVLAALIAGGSAVLWDRFSPQAFWDRVDEYGATSATLLSVMMPWLMKPPASGDDHHNTLDKVHMQPLPENYDAIAERFGFDFVTVAFAQTESGAPVVGVINAAEGEHATPAEYRQGKNPEEIVAASREFGLPVVADIDEERYMGQVREDIVEVAILNERDEPVATGEVGELAVRPKEPGLLLESYYNKPERTLEATRNLWFHTGDAAYRDAEGNFYFVDRKGDVIRRRGENISSVQIQDEVNAHDAVDQAAAFPVDAPEGGEDQIAVAVESGGDLASEDLAAFLDGRLPAFMQPDHYVFVDEIPTTETNKMEKYQLRQSFEEDHR